MMRKHKQKPALDRLIEYEIVDAPISSSDDDEDAGVSKVTVAEAAAKIDAADLRAFLVESSEILLMRLADYFGSAFSSVSSAQFPWVKLFKENSVAKMTDIPLSHISYKVHIEAKDCIIHQSDEALSSFVLWSLDCICTSEDSKKVSQDISSKSQVGNFVALAIVLRQRPYALVNVLPKLSDTSKYQMQDKLAIVAWMIAQVSREDLAIGLYSWACNLLPIVNEKNSNPQSTDTILQIVETILSSPKAKSLLVSGVISNGERIIPPFALELLIRVTFPLCSARIEATERFEAIYPTLKDVALAGSNAMKEEALQILSFAIEASKERTNVALSDEAYSICTWCLTQNVDCYKLWMAKRKQKPAGSSNATEQQSEEQSLPLIESQKATNADVVDAPVRSVEDGDDSDNAGLSKHNGKAEEKKVKQKMPEKPKVTFEEAASKINAADLNTYIVKSSEIQLRRLADYFVRAFSAVSSAQFPWVNMFRENSVARMTTVPLSHISDDVYKASIDWITQQPFEALSSFVLWSLDCIFEDLASQQASSVNSENVAQDTSSKSQVGIFVALALVLQGRPCAFVKVLPMLRETSKYQGQDMFVVVAWMIAQASLGDLAVGLYSWAENLLPHVNENSSNGDNILQIVEEILSTPNARFILESGVVVNKERIIPPSTLEILIQVTFPMSSARTEATERFEAIYPTLKEVALSGSIVMKEALQILSFATEAVGESKNVRLSNEAASICSWCLTQNAECYKLWDTIYLENPEASLIILKSIYVDHKYLHVGTSVLGALRITLNNFRQKNKAAIASGGNVALFKEADKYCKVILRRSYRKVWWIIGTYFFILTCLLILALSNPNLDMKSR